MVGPNGSGKTNLLEAILITATGSSYRGRDMLVVKFEQPWARIDVSFTDNTNRILKLTKSGELLQKEFDINGAKLKRLMGTRVLPVVLFEPNHLTLINGEPGLRREFMDEFAAQLTVGLKTTQKAFKRVLQQRNSLLKQQASQNRFFAWDIQFCELATQIVDSRLSALEQINKKLLKTYKQLGGHAESLEINYASPLSVGAGYDGRLMSALLERHETEKQRGYTLSGPQRDDFVVLFDGIDARHRASRGEIRTILLAIKIIELELLADKKPILLLDDVFSELDGKRRKALARRLKKYQTFITTTDADVVVDHFQDAHIIPVG